MIMQAKNRQHVILVSSNLCTKSLTEDIFTYLLIARCEVEIDVQFGEAAVLRGTVATQQGSHGKAPRLPVPVSL